MRLLISIEKLIGDRSVHEKGKVLYRLLTVFFMRVLNNIQYFCIERSDELFDQKSWETRRNIKILTSSV